MSPSEFSSGGFLYKIERISFKIDVDCLYDIKKASVGRNYRGFLINFILHDSEEMSNSVSFEKEYKCCFSSKEDGVKGLKNLVF